MDVINILGGDKMAAILQTTIEMNFVHDMLEFRFNFHWWLFNKVLWSNHLQMMF